jgi:hypothetical protein
LIGGGQANVINSADLKWHGLGCEGELNWERVAVLGWGRSDVWDIVGEPWKICRGPRAA